MSTLDRSVVEKVAGLARIALTDDEIGRFTQQLSVVLGAIDRLRTVDTSAVPPTASVLPIGDVMRDDVVRPSLSQEDVFRNAPQRDGDHFRVQTVLQDR